jgi:hypothetical protein
LASVPKAATPAAAAPPSEKGWEKGCALVHDAGIVARATTVVLGKLRGGRLDVVGERPGPERRVLVHVPGKGRGTADADQLGGNDEICPEARTCPPSAFGTRIKGSPSLAMLRKCSMGNMSCLSCRRACGASASWPMHRAVSISAASFQSSLNAAASKIGMSTGEGLFIALPAFAQH